MLRPTKGMRATPLRRRRSPALCLGRASDGGSEEMARPDPMIEFAELDAQNSYAIAEQLLSIEEVVSFMAFRDERDYSSRHRH